jgi:tetratricopeptide (TPR) repeat protein
MRVAVLCFLVLEGCVCASRAPSDAGTTVDGGRAAFDPWAPVPAALREAMALRSSDPEKALARVQALEEAARDAGDDRVVALALHRQGDLTLERSYYLRALALHELRGDQAMVGVVANDLGLLRDDDQLEWFALAVKARRGVDDVRGLRASLSNLGGALVIFGKPHEGIAALEEALPLAQQLGDADAESKIELNLASGFERLGDFDSATVHFWRAADVGQALGRGPSQVCQALVYPTELCGDDHQPLTARPAVSAAPDASSTRP